MTRAWALGGIIALCFVTPGAALRLDAPPRSGQAQSEKLQGVTYRAPGGTRGG